jgi:hypothetical protein
MLAYALQQHEGALRASLQAVYGIRLSGVRSQMRALELADLVAYLPDGCPLWQSVGGPRAWSPETHLLNLVEFRLRVLDWRKTNDGKHGHKAPKLHKPPPLAHEKQAEQTKQATRAAAWEARQRRRTE